MEGLNRSMAAVELSDTEIELKAAVEAIWKISKNMALMTDRILKLEEKSILAAMSNKSFLDTLESLDGRANNIEERLDTIDDFLEEL